jgi:hypothetical protein
MRRRHYSVVLATVGLALNCQSARTDSDPPGSGITVDRDFWPVKCTYGYSDANPVLLAFDLAGYGRDADEVVVGTLEGAGYTVELSVINTFRTMPRVDWPENASPDVRRYVYPGTAVLLVMGMDADGTRHTFGGVHALCKSNPGAPDSITTIAQSLDARIVRDAFASHGIGPYERPGRR